MRLHPLLMALIILALPGLAFADDHKADGYGGGSGSRGSFLGGFEAAYTRIFSDGDFGFVANVSVHFGEHEGEDIARTTLLGGLQWTLPEPGGREGSQSPQSRNQYTFALQMLVGAVFTDTGDGTVPAVALGGQYDYIFNRDDPTRGWGVRARADYVFTDGSDNFPRVSFGLVYRIGDD